MLALATLAVVLILGPTEETSAQSWTGGGDGVSWDDAANWNGGLPTATSVATISGAFAVDLGSPATAGSLLLQDGATLRLNGFAFRTGPSPNGILTIDDATITGDGDIDVRVLSFIEGAIDGFGEVLIRDASTIAASSPGLRSITGKIITVNTSLTVNDVFNLGDNTVLSIMPGAELTLADYICNQPNNCGSVDDPAPTNWPSIINNGSLVLVPSIFAPRIITARVDGSGSIAVVECAPTDDCKSFEFRGGASIGGDVTVGANAIIEFIAGSFNFNSANFSGNGSVIFGASAMDATIDGSYDIAGQTTVRRGRLVFDGSSNITNLGQVIEVSLGGEAVLNSLPAQMPDSLHIKDQFESNVDLDVNSVAVVGGEIAGVGHISTNELLLNSGSLRGSKIVTVHGDVMVGPGSGNYMRESAGIYVGGASGFGTGASVTQDGNMFLGNGASIEVEEGVTWTMTRSIGIHRQAPLGGISEEPSLTLNGNLIKIGGPSSSALIEVLLEGNGTIDVREDELDLFGGGSFSGDYLAEAATELRFRSGSFDFSAASFAGAGNVQFGANETTSNITTSYEITGQTEIAGSSITFDAGLDLGNLGTSVVVSSGTLGLNVAPTVMPDFLELRGGLATTVPLAIDSLVLRGFNDVVLAGPADVTTNALLWSSGTVEGPGHLIVLGRAAIDGVSYSRRVRETTLDLRGPSSIRGTLRLSNAAVVEVRSSASLDFIDGADIIAAEIDAVAPQLNNAGAIAKVGSTAKSEIPVLLNNDSVVTIGVGELALLAGGVSSGDFNVEDGATLTFGYSTFAAGDGDYDFPGANFSGSGTIDFHSSRSTSSIDGTYDISGETIVSGFDLDITTQAVVNDLGRQLRVGNGTLALNSEPGNMPNTLVTTGASEGSGALVLSVPLQVDSMRLAGATISGPVDVVTRAVNWTSGTVDLEGTFWILGKGQVSGTSYSRKLNGGRIVIDDDMSINGNVFRLGDGAILEISPSGSLELLNGVDITIEGSVSVQPLVLNRGIIRKSAGTSSIRTDLENRGTIDFVGGGLTFESTSGLFNTSEGLIQGNGTLRVSSAREVTHEGSLAPGGATGDTLIYQGDFDNRNAVLVIDIDETAQFLEVIGNATLGGDLVANSVGLNEPTVGTVLPIVSAPFIEGAFDNVSGPLLSNGKGASALYEPTLTQLEVVQLENRPPTAYPDRAFTLRDQAVVVNVVSNDFDPDRELLRIDVVSGVTSGSASIVEGGVEYAPAPGFTGEALFSYTIQDAAGAASAGIATIVVIDPVFALFSNFGEEVVSPAPGVIRERTATLDAALLSDLAADEQPTVALNLFDDVLDVLDRTASETWQNGNVSWTGTSGIATDVAVIDIAPGGSSAYGQMTSRGRLLEFVQVAGNDYIIRELIEATENPDDADEDDIPATAGPTVEVVEVFAQATDSAPEAGSAAAGSSQASTQETSVIDILVVYTDAADDAASANNRDIDARIRSAVAFTNESFVNSDIDARARLVATASISYNETQDAGKDVRRIRDEGNDPATPLYALKQAFGADVVALVVGNLDDSGGRAAGILGDKDNLEFRDKAYFVVPEGNMGTTYTFSHELGHIMGARHDRRVDKSLGFNHGYVNPPENWGSNADRRWRTVMAYPNKCDAEEKPKDDGSPACPRLLQWSDPNASRLGQPLGKDAGQPNSAYNTRRLRETKATVAAFFSPAPVISGTVTDISTGQPMENVEIKANVLFGIDVFTDADGFYEVTVPAGQDVRIYPVFSGYEFVPDTLSFSNLLGDRDEDFAGYPLYELSGTVTLGGAPFPDIPVLLPSRGSDSTDANGSYAIILPWGYTGYARPLSNMYDFTPEGIDFGDGATGDVVQDFEATLKRYAFSGVVRDLTTGQALPNVTITGLPGDPVTDAFGAYYVEVDHGWTGVFTPQKVGYNFEPFTRVVDGAFADIDLDFDGYPGGIARSDWPVFGKNEAQWGALETAASGPTTRWAYTASDEDLSPPSVGPTGEVFLTTSRSSGNILSRASLIALDADGNELWKKYPSDLGVVSAEHFSQPVVGTAGVVYLSWASSSQSGVIGYDYVRDVVISSPSKSGRNVLPPVISPASKLYWVAGGDVNIYDLNASPGGLLQSITLSTAVDFSAPGTPAFHGTRTYLRDGADVVALDNAGVEQWRFSTGDNVIGSPVVAADGTVYAASAEPAVYALTASGSQKWRHTTASRPTAPAVGFGGTLYVGTSSGELIAINPANGQRTWGTTLPDRISRPPVTSYTSIRRFSVVADDEQVYVASGRSLYAIDAVRRTTEWELDLNPWLSEGRVALSESGAYVSLYDRVFALKPASRAFTQISVLLAEGLEDPDKVAFILWATGPGGPLALTDDFGDGGCTGGPVILPNCPYFTDGLDKSSPLLSVIAGEELFGAVAERAANLDDIVSGETSEGILNEFNVKFAEDEVRVVVVAGLKEPSRFLPNPEQRATNLQVFLSDDLAGQVDTENSVFVLAGNFVTDASAFNFSMLGTGEVQFNDLSFGDLSNLTVVPAGTYQLNLTGGGLGKTGSPQRTVELDLTDHAGELVTLFATGFVDPDANGGGPPVTIDANGSSGEIVVTGSVDKGRVAELPTAFSLDAVYPNPTSNNVTIGYSLPTSEDVEVLVFDILGRAVVRSLKKSVVPGVHEEVLSVGGLGSGVYFIRLLAGEWTEVRKVTVVR